MQLPQDAMLLRVFVGENDKHGGKPLYEAIVLAARERGLAGATVIRGPMGFGALEPAAHRQDPAALGGPAARRRGGG